MWGHGSRKPWKIYMRPKLTVTTSERRLKCHRRQLQHQPAQAHGLSLPKLPLASAVVQQLTSMPDINGGRQRQPLAVQDGFKPLASRCRRTPRIERLKRWPAAAPCPSRTQSGVKPRGVVVLAPLGRFGSSLPQVLGM